MGIYIDKRGSHPVLRWNICWIHWIVHHVCRAALFLHRKWPDWISECNKYVHRACFHSPRTIHVGVFTMWVRISFLKITLCLKILVNQPGCSDSFGEKQSIKMCLECLYPNCWTSAVECTTTPTPLFYPVQMDYRMGICFRKPALFLNSSSSFL